MTGLRSLPAGVQPRVLGEFMVQQPLLEQAHAGRGEEGRRGDPPLGLVEQIILGADRRRAIAPEAEKTVAVVTTYLHTEWQT